MAQLKDFVKAVQIVLPGLQLMGDVLEACGLNCEVNHFDDNSWQTGCRWEQGEMSMNLTLALGDEELVWLQLWDKNNDNLVVQARSENGAIEWNFIEFDRGSEERYSPLLKLEEDIVALVDGDYEKLDKLDESMVREIVNMFAVFFKRQS